MGRKGKTSKLIKANVKGLEQIGMGAGHEQIKKLKELQFPEIERIVYSEALELNIPFDEKLITDELLEDFRHFCLKEAIYGAPTTQVIKIVEELIKDYDKKEVVEIGAGNGWFSKLLGIRGVDNYSQKDGQLKNYYESMGQPAIEYKNKEIIKSDAIQFLKRMKGIKVVFGSYITDISENVWGIDESKIFQNDIEKYIMLCSTTTHMGKQIFKNPNLKTTIIADKLLIRSGRNGFIALIEKA